MTSSPRLDVALGYDPGGDGRHGVAALRLAEGGARVVGAEVATLTTTEQAIAWLQARLPKDDDARAAIGIDTLTVWSMGPAGWRPADRWLRSKYPEAAKSIAAPNSLFGAMVINGMAAIVRLREHAPALVVSETHPKVLYLALTGERHSFKSERARITARLCEWIGVEQIPIADDHQWDALVSAYAVRQGVLGAWQGDLHTRPTSDGEALVRPAGASSFFWPGV